MASITRAIDYLLHDGAHFLDSCIKHLGFLFPDKLYLSLRYRCIIGRWIDWNNPKTFTEKIQWLKLYDYKPEYSTLVDKYSVKKYVADIIGCKYIIPTINVWNTVEEIDWDKLPSSFVLKTTNGGGGGGVVICNDIETFDKQSAKSKLNTALKIVDGKEFREHPYDGIKGKIIAETLIKPKNGELKDYKFFCFNGKVKCFKVDFGRFVEHHANYYDSDGNLLPFGEKWLEPDYNHVEVMPDNLSEMIDIAECLSTNYRFIRVDLYNVDGKIYFGELTFYPGSGLVPLTSLEWDKTLGSWIKL